MSISAACSHLDARDSLGLKLKPSMVLGREPVLRVVGGPRIVQVENPFPKTPGELRTILEIFPLKLEKVVEVSENQEPIVEEVARGEGEAKGVQETVRKAAEAIREDEQA